jgi:hypothetical protein
MTVHNILLLRLLLLLMSTGSGPPWLHLFGAELQQGLVHMPCQALQVGHLLLSIHGLVTSAAAVGGLWLQLRLICLLQEPLHCSCQSSHEWGTAQQLTAQQLLHRLQLVVCCGLLLPGPGVVQGIGRRQLELQRSHLHRRQLLQQAWTCRCMPWAVGWHGMLWMVVLHA